MTSAAMNLLAVACLVLCLTYCTEAVPTATATNDDATVVLATGEDGLPVIPDVSETREKRSYGIGMLCNPRGAHKNTPGMGVWCQRNCEAGHCPPTHCRCVFMQESRKKRQAVSYGDGRDCSPVWPQNKVPGMKRWCKVNCAAGYCPASHCRCAFFQG